MHWLRVVLTLKGKFLGVHWWWFPNSDDGGAGEVRDPAWHPIHKERRTGKGCESWGLLWLQKLWDGGAQDPKRRRAKQKGGLHLWPLGDQGEYRDGVWWCRDRVRKAKPGRDMKCDKKNFWWVHLQQKAEWRENVGPLLKRTCQQRTHESLRHWAPSSSQSLRARLGCPLGCSGHQEQRGGAVGAGWCCCKAAPNYLW